MDPVYLVRVSDEHGIDVLDWMATSMVRHIVSCHSRRAHPSFIQFTNIPERHSPKIYRANVTISVY